MKKFYIVFGLLSAFSMQNFAADLTEVAAFMPTQAHFEGAREELEGLAKEINYIQNTGSHMVIIDSEGIGVKKVAFDRGTVLGKLEDIDAFYGHPQVTAQYLKGMPQEGRYTEDMHRRFNVVVKAKVFFGKEAVVTPYLGRLVQERNAIHLAQYQKGLLLDHLNKELGSILSRLQ